MNSINVIINLLNEKIKDLIKKIDDNSENINAPSRLLQLSEELKENPFLIGEDDIEMELEEYFNELEDKELLKQTLDDIFVLKVVANGKKKGINISLNSDELSRLERINDALQKVDEIHKRKKEQKINEISANRVLKSKYSSLYDKLLAGEHGTEHYTPAEIDLLIELSSPQDLNFKIEILEYIRKISSIINVNIIQKTSTPDEEESTNEIEIDEEILKDLFEKYGYEYSNMPNKYKQLIRKRCKLQRIISIFEYIEENKSQLGFLKKYGKVGVIAKTKSGINNEFRRLYLMLRYATKDTLDYLLEDAKKREVSIEDILRIDGVYKHINRSERKEGPPGPQGKDETVSGSFEYYKRNSIILDELTRQYQMLTGDMNIDFYKTTLDECSEFFKTPDDIIRKNIEITRKYGLTLIKKYGGTYRLYKPTYLTARNLENSIDLMLENPPLYDYILRYPTLLREEKNSKKAIDRRQRGILQLNNQGELVGVRLDRTEPNINRKHIEKLAENIHSKLIEASQNSEEIENYIDDEVTGKLNEYIDKIHQNELCFNINGVFVSKFKFYRVWTSMMNAYSKLSANDKKNCKLNDMVLYALTYNSCYTEDELEKIQGIIPGLKLGGEGR